MQTMTTCKITEVPDVVERIARRWAGSLFELAVRPQASSGLAVITVTTPAGVEEPADPGPSALQVQVRDQEMRLSELTNRLEAMTRARDESDAALAEAQREAEELDQKLRLLAP